MLSQQKTQMMASIKQFIQPANPLIQANTFIQTTNQQQSVRPTFVSPQDIDSDDNISIHDRQSLTSVYKDSDVIFCKWPGRNCNRNRVDYCANKNTFTNGGMTKQHSIQFHSNFPTGNLLLVFKVQQIQQSNKTIQTGPNQYDLIMQNDTNTSGYTQYFNFIVNNKQKTGTLHFRIANFYKKSALYSQGMKPLSKSLLNDKSWKRACYGVSYYNSDVLMQDRKGTYYKVLQFKYDFNYQNDSVQFASSIPYSYLDLDHFIKSLTPEKVRVKYLGVSPLKNIITMLQISSEKQQKSSKKAVVILARQHPGQTVSSFLVEGIISQLLRFTQQSDYLLSKYNFYVFPMVNVDGVTVGNYRSNLYGYDLNRSWHMEAPRKVPQVVAIKNQLKKIMKKEQIQLIIDLHGHSRKMNSFFYGNTFGKSNMIFPYVASKMDSFIDYSSCRFNDEEQEKSKTARVILGNLIKQTGSAYTYQVSLYGGIKNNKKVPFNQEHYQDLSKSLILALYKTNIELSKQQNLLKQCIFLKEARKQIKAMQETLFKNEDSDQQAKKTTAIINTKQNTRIGTKHGSLVETLSLSKQFNDSQTQFQFNSQEYNVLNPLPFRVKNKKQNSQRHQSGSFLISNFPAEETNTHKRDLMDKLRIFGLNFNIKSNQNVSIRLPTTATSQTQTNLTFQNVRSLPITSELSTSPIKYQLKSKPQKDKLIKRLLYAPPLLQQLQAKQQRQRRLTRPKLTARVSKSNSTGIQIDPKSFKDLFKFGKINFT